MADERCDGNGADLLQGEVEEHELGAVRERGHHPVERLEAQLEEVQRQVVGDAVDVGVGVLAFAVYERHSFSELQKDRGKFVGKGFVLPITFLAIALRILRRKGNDAGQHYVDAVKPPSMTMISPVTKRLDWMRFIMV